MFGKKRPITGLFVIIDFSVYFTYNKKKRIQIIDDKDKFSIDGDAGNALGSAYDTNIQLRSFMIWVFRDIKG